MVILVALGTTVFTTMAPQFGQKPRGADLERIQQSPNYGKGEFVNSIETKLASFPDLIGTLPKFIFGKNLKPSDTLPVRYHQDHTQLAEGFSYVTWFGHSAFLIEMEGKRILIDPMLTDWPSPVPFGSRRFPNQKPVSLDKLGNIDFVIISHDHYDHLDYNSIIALRQQVDHFYTALGVGSHLKRWGIPCLLYTSDAADDSALV